MLKLILLIFFVSESPAEVKVLFIGDSLTDGYGIAKEKSYPSLLAKKFQEEKLSVKIVNGSISGSTTSSALSRYKWFRKVKPGIVVLALGANDGLRGIRIKKIKKNLERAIVLMLQDKIKVLLVGMHVPPNYGEIYSKAFHQLFWDLAKEYKLPFVPFLLEKVGGVPEMNLADGIHPNEKGNKIMMETVYKHLRPLL